MKLLDYLLKPHLRRQLEKIKLSFVDIDEASIYCGYDVFQLLRLSKFLKKAFQRKNELIKLFEEIELPLESVLSQMEMNGITIDIPYLDKLSKN